MLAELKKWTKYKLFYIIIVISLLLPIFAIANSINNYEGYFNEGNKIVEMHGLDGLRKSIDQNKVKALDLDEMTSAIKYYQKNKDDRKIEIKMEAIYPNLTNLMFGAFQSKINSSKYNVLNTEDGRMFYESVKQRSIENLIMDGNKESEAISYVNKMFGKIDKPYVVGDPSPWVILFRALYASLFFLFFIISIWGAVVFSIEKECNMEKVLFVEGSGKEKVRNSKILSFILFSMLMYIYTMLACILPIMYLIGFGQNISVQSIPGFINFLQNWKVHKLLFVYIIITIFSVLSWTMITSIVSDFIKNNVLSWVSLLSFLIIILFFIRSKFLISYIMYSFIGSINLVLLTVNIGKFNILGLSLNSFYANLFISLIVILICILIYKRNSIKKCIKNILH